MGNSTAKARMNGQTLSFTRASLKKILFLVKGLTSGLMAVAMKEVCWMDCDTVMESLFIVTKELCMKVDGREENLMVM